MKRSWMTACAVLSCTAGSGGVAHAVLIGADGYEPPAYTAGNPVEDSSGTAINGGTGFTGQDVADAQRANVVVGAPGLASSQALQIVGAASDNGLITRTFATQTGSPVYFSFRFRTSSNGGTTDDDFVQVGLSNAGAEPKASIGYGASTGTLFARAGSGTASPTVQAQTASFPAAGAEYLLVGRVSQVNGSSTYNQVDLFVNPIDSTEPAATVTATAAAGASTTVGSFDRLTIRTARLDANDLYSLDDLRVGTTFADVVPEPTAAGALALAGLAGLARRRRRRAARG